MKTSKNSGSKSQSIPLQVAISLRQGTVYYFQHRDLSSPLSHFFIVISPSPLKGKTILLSVITSQVEKVEKFRSDMPNETLVKISVDEYDELSKISIVDCNKYFVISLTDLLDKISSNQIEYKKDLPQKHLELIIKGILASPMIAKEIKDIFRK